MLISVQDLYLNDTLLEFLPGNFGRSVNEKTKPGEVSSRSLSFQLERSGLDANSFVDFVKSKRKIFHFASIDVLVIFSPMF